MDILPRSQRGTLKTRPRQYGASVNGAPLYVWMPLGEPKCVLIGGVHGEEPEATILLSRALRSLPRPPENCAVVLCANPDGVALGTRGNANGVDLNRNLPTMDWSDAPVRHRWLLKHEQEVELSPGDAPGSEPENTALARLLLELQPQTVVSVHGHLECVETATDNEMARWLAEKSGLPLKNGIGYPTPGSLGTWGQENNIAIVTYEIEPANIEALVERHLPVFQALLAGECWT